MAHERKPLLQLQEDLEQPPTAMSSSSSSYLSETQKSPAPSSPPPPYSGPIFIASLIALWYSSNIGVILLNKFLLSNYNFRFPIFLTICHAT
ncbi:hypothetical protein MLD38_020132 [Melastoma candidum]|uniref:Uncharacterized protein n=1 Tax=Melastoma candidum TaxID=119954 RepID=A0ACB9QC67_9MYRT|nr:hypothetical protein MLD38_020132 [Melastoma candidum]